MSLALSSRERQLKEEFGLVASGAAHAGWRAAQRAHRQRASGAAGTTCTGRDTGP
jgi:hypothetical protein